MNPLATYISQVRSELAKVIWPKRADVIKLTMLVIVISIIVGAYVSGLDYIFVKILQRIISI